ncbi:MAG: ATP-dependent helicase [Chloroherpetonaceae bacterium]|nr:UvrD-helicase domain-containing protein [Chthonomonadaceae bacterium]MDW8206732.1 ATP-dependent helicase [Chloroherpetonaceae bacterium]
MSDLNGIRRAARRHHQRLRQQCQPPHHGLPHAEQLLAAAEAETGLARQPLPPGDTLLAGAQAVFNRQFACIYYDQSLPASTARFVQAHEFAHFWLHSDVQQHTLQLTDEWAEVAGEFQTYSLSLAESYSPTELREREANAFAAEFLLPAPTLRQAFQQGLTAEQIAEQTGVSESCVLGQMTRALLLPDTCNEPNEPQETPALPLPDHPDALWKHYPLDPSQHAAATVSTGPVLVEAGPGTGKTRALIGRLLHLLIERHIPPENIMAITFSNRATEEMRSRLRQTVGHLADRVWISTFHALGAEILRREGHHIGVPLRPTLLEPADAALLLERYLDRLSLEQYEYLQRPSLPFPDILHCISRAKDELKTPDQYLQAAQRQLQNAHKDEQILAARKALEVARIYATYQHLLQENGCLDFGDLIMRTVELFDRFPEVLRRWQQQYPHILADEYQDVNRACAHLLRRLAGNGAGLWAVGDVRQAIYRFRGAAPANLARFERDFPGGKRISLEVNYRANPALVSLISAAAQRMDPEWSPENERLWTAQRGATERPAVTLAIAEDPEAQADGLATEIHAHALQGVPYPEQAVLCRTNQQAAEIAQALASRGIPVQFLGSLLERPEVKDLLAVLALACKSDGSALLRVATIPTYAIPRPDVLALLHAARATGRPFPGALALTEDLPDLSPAGRAGLRKLRAHLEPIVFRGNAWLFLTRYLFQTSDYLHTLAPEHSLEGQQQRMALHQLLQMAMELTIKLFSEGGREAQAAFLEYLRQLMSLGESRPIDRHARDLQRLQGVQVMTAHAAKGLEFSVVYLPNLARDLFPIRRQGRMAHPPSGLLGASVEEDETTEEECLFFVAMSRARDHLVLSYPETRQNRSCTPSPLLINLDEILVECNVHRVYWQRTAREPVPGTPALPQQPGAFLEVTLSDLEQYRECPRQYYYQHVVHLPVSDERTPYRTFHRSLNETLRWLAEEHNAGRTPDLTAVVTHWNAQWEAHFAGEENAQTRVLRQRALAMLENGHRWILSTDGALPRVELWATLSGGRVRLRADLLEPRPDGSIRVTQQIKRRARKDDHTDPALALLRKAARQTYPHVPIEVQLHYLTDGQSHPVREQPRYEPLRVAKYDEALAGILAGNFAPHPEERRCAFCPFFLICPHD